MKLISNFKDYYDGVLNSVFRDEEKTLYKRETYSNNKENKLDDLFIFSYMVTSLEELDLTIKGVSLFFCGQQYNYIIIDEKNNKTSKNKILIFQNKNDYFIYLKSLKGFKTQRLSYWRNDYDSETRISKFFDFKIEKMQELSYNNKTCCFLKDRKGDSYIFNPNLSKIHFEKIKDPYSAAQEVYNYVSGVLSCVCTPEPVLTNNDILIAKGFDPKTSFRKM